MNTGLHCYALHGLTIHSELEIPHLSAGAGGEPDVIIAFGAVDELPPDEASRFRNWSARPGEMTITAFGTGRFGVRQGRWITIEREAGAEHADLVSFTLGSAMSALLQQRQLLPLHASSIVTDKGAVMVTGRSGAGKSTLVAHLVAEGYPLLADDVTAIGLGEDGRPVAYPGLPAMRLWRDSLERLGRQDDVTGVVREGLEKYYLPGGSAPQSPQPLRGILRLSTMNEGPARVTELPPAESVIWLGHHVHRKHFLPGMGLRPLLFERTLAIASHAPMLEVVRADEGSPPAHIAGILFDWLEAKERGGA